MFTPQIGHFNELKILGENEFGLNLDGGEEFGSILLPKRYAPKVFETGERIRVFLYLDSDDRLIATTESPIATADEFAYLRVIDSTRSAKCYSQFSKSFMNSECRKGAFTSGERKTVKFKQAEPLLIKGEWVLIETS